MPLIVRYDRSGRLVVRLAAGRFDESKHPRGKPGNAGQFAEKGRPAARERRMAAARKAEGIPLVPVESSNLDAIGYNRLTKVLYIKFKGGRIYKYYGVEHQTYHALMSPRDGSHGKAFHRLIKTAGHAFERLS